MNLSSSPFLAKVFHLYYGASEIGTRMREDRVRGRPESQTPARCSEKAGVGVPMAGARMSQTWLHERDQEASAFRGLRRLPPPAVHLPPPALGPPRAHDPPWFQGMCLWSQTVITPAVSGEWVPGPGDTGEPPLLCCYAPASPPYHASCFHGGGEGGLAWVPTGKA